MLAEMLSIASFDFALAVGSAATKITGVATEISKFCLVLNQVESALAKSEMRAVFPHSSRHYRANHQNNGDQCSVTLRRF